MLAHKIHLHTFKSIKIVQSVFTDESDVHLEIKITKIFRKSPPHIHFGDI